MRLISFAHLPNASIKNVGIISKDDILPYEAYIKCQPRAFIHNDGGVCRFFKVPQINVTHISKIIKTIPLGSAIQIYRFHKPEGEAYYLSIRRDIDYKNIFQKHLFDQFTLNPSKRTILRIYEETNKAIDEISEAISGCTLEETEYSESLIPKILMQCEINGYEITAPIVKSNMSYLKVGNDRFATIGSINNMSVIPKARGCLNEHRFLQRVLVSIPSRERLDALKEVTLDNGKMIKELSGDAAQSRKVHVDTVSVDQSIENIMEIRGKICYADASFFIYDKTTEGLETQYNRFYDTMERNNIALYCHTNTSRSAYTTFFPGNEAYGERYSLLFEYFLNMFMMNVVEL